MYIRCSIILFAFSLLANSQAVLAEHAEIEELLVTAKQDTREFELADTVDIGPDSGKLLRRSPGASLNSNGPLTGIAQYRGMYGSRISTHIDGVMLSAGGPNWMDPPLSYAPAAILDSLVVYRGIAPVSAGQETIGGVINATTWNGDFTDGELEIDGRMRAGAQSVSDAYLLSGVVTLANDQQRLKLSAFAEEGDDAAFSSGKILPTGYKRHRFDLGYGLRIKNHTLQFDYGRNETGDSGTPALPMDIQYIDSDMFRLHYDFHDERFQINAKLYYSDIDHGMSNFHLRPPPGDPSMWRRNIATGENLGFSLLLDINEWKFGLDGHYEQHDSDIDNPNNPMFFVENFNQAERQVIGIFTEHQMSFGDNWLFELGLRYNNISMDADPIDGTPAILMPAAMMLRDNFNNGDRSSSDHNVDWVTKAYYQATPAMRLYAGLSRKSRSPSYQERYLWLPLEATSGLADMRIYTGKLDLDEEVAHEIEVGFDWSRNGFKLSPRLFYRDVNDYIQGSVSGNQAALMFTNMMNIMNGTSNAAPLEFNNVDATFYGMDADWRYDINDNWSVDGVVSYVRGQRDDIDDNLYRISPLNAQVAVDYAGTQWGARLETHLYDSQNKVSLTNSEQSTSGYALINLQAYWNINKSIKLGLNIDNITDENYNDHLGGYNRVMGNPDILRGARLPGYGRNFSARIDYQW